MDDGRWTMDDGRWTMLRHAIWPRNVVTQDFRSKTGFLQRLCFCHEIYKYFVGRLGHTKIGFSGNGKFSNKM